MIEWNSIVSVVSSLLFIFLFWKEIKRKNHSFLVARLVATTLSIISLSCITLPVYYTEKERVNDKEAVILTDGFSKDSVIRFMEGKSDIPLISFDKNVKQIGSYQVNYLADISLVPGKYRDVKTYIVFGFGFSQNDLDKLYGASISFHPNKLATGIAAIHSPQKIKAGGKFLIEGLCNNVSAAKLKITISHFGETIDSVYVSANTEEQFHLHATPKNEGTITYQFSVISRSDTLEKETLPVQVEENKLLTICLLSSSPDFDTKFLKNYLSGEGNAVVARSRISKGKYATDYLNTSPVSLDKITASLLAKYDVLIADASELNTLSNPELACIQEQIAQKGMGLIVKEDTLLTPPFLSSFPAMLSTDTLQQLITYLSDTSDKMPPVFGVRPLFLKTAANSQILVFDSRNRPYAISTLYGSGKIVFTTLPNTYTWALSGHGDTYQRFWTSLLNQVTKPLPEQESWSISPSFALVDQPVTIRLQTNAPGIPQAQVNGTLVYLANTPDLPFKWSGIYYPKKEGWQTGIGLNGKPFYFYTYNRTQWQQVFASQKLAATRQYALQHLVSSEINKETFVYQKTLVSKIWFFLLFILGCSFLWLENKNVFAAK